MKKALVKGSVSSKVTENPYNLQVLANISNKKSQESKKDATKAKISIKSDELFEKLQSDFRKISEERNIYARNTQTSSVLELNLLKYLHKKLQLKFMIALSNVPTASRNTEKNPKPKSIDFTKTIKKSFIFLDKPVKISDYFDVNSIQSFYDNLKVELESKLTEEYFFTHENWQPEGKKSFETLNEDKTAQCEEYKDLVENLYGSFSLTLVDYFLTKK